MDNVFVEHEWLAKHPEVFEKHVGKWIAVAGKKIAASAKSISALKNKLARLRLRRPLIMLVPRREEEFSLL